MSDAPRNLSHKIVIASFVGLTSLACWAFVVRPWSDGNNAMYRGIYSLPSDQSEVHFAFLKGNKLLSIAGTELHDCAQLGTLRGEFGNHIIGPVWYNGLSGVAGKYVLASHSFVPVFFEYTVTASEGANCSAYPAQGETRKFRADFGDSSVFFDDMELVRNSSEIIAEMVETVTLILEIEAGTVITR